jgi:tetratricopeptide (TPR) repeat protein
MAEAVVNLGLALQEYGDTEQAAACLERALELAPDDVDAHVNYAVCCLQQGRFVPGWAEYEWRWRRPHKLKRPFKLPVWDGSALAGRSILVYAEQGIGDEIMFSSCIPDLCALADRVVLECEPRLAPLFSRSFPDVVVHGGYQNEPAAWLAASGGADVQLACGSLPQILRPDEAGFPGHAAYLVPDDLLVQKWRGRYAGLGDGLKVGLTWKGGGNELNRLRRSIDLVDWAPLLSFEGVEFINIQYGDCHEEIQDIQKSSGITVHDWPDADPLRNLDDFAAQLSALDLVIAIDNSTAHLAGALGVPAWVLLSRVADWRWMLEREDSPWYPGVSLIRQTRDDDWDCVIKTASIKLRERLGKDC